MSDARAASLVAALDGLEPVDAAERDDVAATRALLFTPRPFDAGARDHVTASAFCCGPTGVLLHRHRLLGRWLQPGGHVDDGEAPTDAVLRELVEEAGVAAAHLDPPRLVHVSVHDGPRGHRHYDCRWLVTADDATVAPAPWESQEVGWFEPRAALERCDPDLCVALDKAITVAHALALPAVASWRT